MNVVAGYRPLVTRRIGQAPSSTVQPQQQQPDALPHAATEEPPPEHGYENYNAYEHDEVLLCDHSERVEDDPPYPAEAAVPLSAGAPWRAFHVMLPPAARKASTASTASTASSVTLEHPTRLEVGGRSYEYRGFLLLSQYEVDPPPAQILCGDDVLAVALERVALPSWLDDEAQRRALLSSHAALFGALLPLGDMLPLEKPRPGRWTAAADTAGCRPVHLLPRFVLLDPTAVASAAAEAQAVAGGAEGRGLSGSGVAGGAADGAAAEELRPSELDVLLHTPPPSVLGWIVGAREAAGGLATSQRTPPPAAAWPDGKGGSVRLQLGGLLPNLALPVELGEVDLERAVRAVPRLGLGRRARVKVRDEITVRVRDEVDPNPNPNLIVRVRVEVDRNPHLNPNPNPKPGLTLTLTRCARGCTAWCQVVFRKSTCTKQLISPPALRSPPWAVAAAGWAAAVAAAGWAAAAGWVAAAAAAAGGSGWSRARLRRRWSTWAAGRSCWVGGVCRFGWRARGETRGEARGEARRTRGGEGADTSAPLRRRRWLLR